MFLFSPKYYVTLFLIIPALGFGQDIITGEIIDYDNKTKLSHVSIINLKNRDTIFSALDGHFELKSKGFYIFKKSGYIQKTLNITDNYSVVQLDMSRAQLNEVIVNSSQIPTKLKKSISTINIISSKDIEFGDNVNMAPVLNRAPGVFMQSGALNTNRITIRGIGSRNLFGTAKIRAYFKDVPLTNGSGETTIEDFELASISRFEIIKGAASSYGAGLGGTIHITPKNPKLNETQINSEVSGGSFGLLKGVIGFNHGTTKHGINAIYSNTHSDGYRENNSYDRQSFTMNSSHYIGHKDDISLLLSYTDLIAFIPSSLNKADYQNNPESAAFTWKSAKGFEDSQRGIFGVSWTHDYNNNSKQITSVFSSLKNAYEARPFNILEESTMAYGLRSRFLKATKLFNKSLEYTIGGEFFYDNHNYKTFQNLYKDFPPGTGSVKGNQLSDLKEKRNYYNLFIDSNYSLTKTTTLSIGLNLNQTAYDLEDKFFSSTTHPDQSGSFKFETILSPKFGISHGITSNINIYSNISHGFSPISLEETLLPDGLINTNIKPETGWNYEIGTRGSAFDNALQFNAAIFRLDIKNLLVPRRTAEDEFIGINAGRTQHDGLELTLNYKVFQKENLSINSFLNYTLNNFIFKEFVDDSTDFSGNDLTGVPKDIFNAGIDFDFSFGLYGNINYQYVGSMPITDSNSLYSDSYNLTNFKMGYQSNLSKSLKFNIFLGINNIFNSHYASQILINASGFGGSAPRYYYPGYPVNYFTGFNINYIF